MKCEYVCVCVLPVPAYQHKLFIDISDFYGHFPKIHHHDFQQQPKL